MARGEVKRLGDDSTGLTSLEESLDTEGARVLVDLRGEYLQRKDLESQLSRSGFDATGGGETARTHAA